MEKTFSKISAFLLLFHQIATVDNCIEDFNHDSSDEFMSKLKSTNSFCLLRQNRNTPQPQRGSERSSSGASNLTYNFSSNSSAIQDKSTDSTTLTLTSSSGSSSRNKMVSFYFELKGVKTKLNFQTKLNENSKVFC